MKLIKCFSLATLLIIPMILWPSARDDTFQKFPNECFVETGSCTGEGIQLALNSGFKNISSIEFSERLYLYCKNRFKDQSNVVLFLGPSETQLWNAIESIKKPITFWLDAHYDGGNTAKGNECSPILKELNIIKKHPIKTHTILIDDVRAMGTPGFGFISVDQVINKIYEINSNYEISFEDGYRPGDILVAQIPKNKK